LGASDEMVGSHPGNTAQTHYRGGGLGIYCISGGDLLVETSKGHPGLAPYRKAVKFADLKTASSEETNYRRRSA